MATENKNGWTLETLKVLMDERDRRYGEVSTAKEEAVKVALANAEKAVLVAERNSEKWRDNANEWRASMNDRERQFFSKSMGYVVGFLSALSLIVALLERILGK